MRRAATNLGGPANSLMVGLPRLIETGRIDQPRFGAQSFGNFQMLGKVRETVFETRAAARRTSVVNLMAAMREIWRILFNGLILR